LYDEASDPKARENLARSSAAVADTLDGQIADFQHKTSRAQSEHAKLDPTQIESLRALGYLASDSSASSESERSAIDPKDKIETANSLHRALVDIEEDRHDDAIRELQEFVLKEPETAIGYLELGRALVHQRRYQEALPVLRKSAQKTPDSGMAHYELALALIKTGQWEDALPEMKAAVLCTPKSAQMHFYLGAVDLRLKQIPEATAEFDKTLELDVNHFQANLKYGEMLLLEGDAAAALPKLIKAVKSNPKSPEAHDALANTYQALGQKENALREHALAVQFEREVTE
jgi:tetratricopeptide (TPR) repeat protein